MECESTLLNSPPADTLRRLTGSSNSISVRLSGGSSVVTELRDREILNAEDKVRRYFFFYIPCYHRGFITAVSITRGSPHSLYPAINAARGCRRAAL